MIATFGETLIDLIEQPDGLFKACLGGSVCNFTLALARQGVAVTYLNPLSCDRFGAAFHALFSANGVTLACPASVDRPTAMAVVHLSAQGVPSYAFHYQQVACRAIDAAKVNATLPAPMTLLHTGGLALIPEDAAVVLAVIENALHRAALVSIDANIRLIAVQDADAYLQAGRQALRLAHIVKVSDEDSAHLGFDGPDALADFLFDASAVQLIAYTEGACGARLITRKATVRGLVQKGLPVVDTVGAGDCFYAGLIAYLQRHEKLVNVAKLAESEAAFLQGALIHAMAAASLNVMRAGCDPATWEETRRLNELENP